jgi:hypothetical protein
VDGLRQSFGAAEGGFNSKKGARTFWQSCMSMKFMRSTSTVVRPSRFSSEISRMPAAAALGSADAG